ncbi:hypothetical protein EW026_g3789 [Hermanssonia centrifuga]|uniref:Uncharacterized protein n=1 Tax=Hermanssonia centrifuga TaxID=98765 RepID=A0A4S4KNR3_9APHY|nr:hypothetical protein EW026_g3789 [Hermanssonia centrifuga]
MDSKDIQPPYDIHVIGDITGEADLPWQRGRQNREVDIQFNKFTLLADSSAKVPNLRNKSYSDYNISKPEWDVLELMREVLAEVYDAHQSFSSETCPTVWQTIPTLECLQRRWEIMADTPKFAPVQSAIQAGLAKLQKWYMAIDQTDIYYVCLALDPGIKTEYTLQNWERKYNNSGMAALEEAFDYYAENTTESETVEPAKAQSKTLSTFSKEKKKSHIPRQELHEYLKSPLVPDVSDPVACIMLLNIQY